MARILSAFLPPRQNPISHPEKQSANPSELSGGGGVSVVTGQGGDKTTFRRHRPDGSN